MSHEKIKIKISITNRIRKKFPSVRYQIIVIIIGARTTSKYDHDDDDDDDDDNNDILYVYLLVYHYDLYIEVGHTNIYP
mgnify:CR=1 FL=1